MAHRRPNPEPQNLHPKPRHNLRSPGLGRWLQLLPPSIEKSVYCWYDEEGSLTGEWGLRGGGGRGVLSCRYAGTNNKGQDSSVDSRPTDAPQEVPSATHVYPYVLAVPEASVPELHVRILRHTVQAKAQTLRTTQPLTEETPNTKPYTLHLKPYTPQLNPTA